MKTITAYEYCTLYREGDKHNENDVELKAGTFDRLWKYILSLNNSDAESVMTPARRWGCNCIRTGKYVGTIQTSDGSTIEILPKIYDKKGGRKYDATQCRKILLKMLRHFGDANAKSFQDAGLSTQEDYPILEVYITNYIAATEKLLIDGIKKNYVETDENLRFVKGRIDISRQIKLNAADKTRFAVRYHKYAENIPQNRIISATLQKLLTISHSNANQARIKALLSIMSDIPPSTDIENDLRRSTAGNRLFAAYEPLLQWSEQILLNKGFTTFAGECINQALLFPAEKLFESFIAHLFKKYAREDADKPAVSSQHQKYYLVDTHDDRGLFNLRPDIFIELGKGGVNYHCLIIDTKWKLLDQNSPRTNYGIKIEDMYQLFAYGRKYLQGQSDETGLTVEPHLTLIYPCSDNFTDKLPTDFVYENLGRGIEGLKLSVHAFDLSDFDNYKNQVEKIINKAKETTQETIIKNAFKSDNEEDKELPITEDSSLTSFGKKNPMLVGCYKDEWHKQWITKNKLYYNVRTGNRHGAIDTRSIVPAKRLLLYDVNNPKNYNIYRLDPNQQIIANYEKMQSLGYLEAKEGNSYLLYILLKDEKGNASEVTNHPKYDFEELKRKFTEGNIAKGQPFYVPY